MNVTRIADNRATGVVYAVQDGPNHVSVRPVGATMEDWIDADPDLFIKIDKSHRYPNGFYQK